MSLVLPFDPLLEKTSFWSTSRKVYKLLRGFTSEVLLINIDLPTYTAAFNIPLSSNVRFRSHWAAGKTKDIVVDSKELLQLSGKATKIKIQLNIPKSVAAIAVSKSAGFSSGKFS